MDETVRALERAASQGDPAARERLERARERGLLHETTLEVLAELEALQERLRPIERDLRDEGLKDLRRYAAAVFEREPGLRVIVIQGYTPGFCDGDLCEHEQSAFAGRVDDVEGLRDNEVAADAATGYERALGEFQAALHARYGTDWQLTLRRAGEGQVEVERADWNCGY